MLHETLPLSREDELDRPANPARALVRTPQGLKFESRLVVYDSEMIPNSIIYPI